MSDYRIYWRRWPSLFGFTRQGGAMVWRVWRLSYGRLGGEWAIFWYRGKLFSYGKLR